MIPYARWTLKFTKAKRQDDGTMPSSDLAISVFGYKSHIFIDRKFWFIRKWKTTDAAANDGARLKVGLLDKTNTAYRLYQRLSCLTDMSPFSEPDGLDGLRQGREIVPCGACGLDDVVHVFEDGIGQPVGAEELPDVFDRVQFGSA